MVLLGQCSGWISGGRPCHHVRHYQTKGRPGQSRTSSLHEVETHGRRRNVNICSEHLLSSARATTGRAKGRRTELQSDRPVYRIRAPHGMVLRYTVEEGRICNYSS